MNILIIILTGTLIAVALYSYEFIEISKKSKIYHLIGLAIIGYLSSSELVHSIYNLLLHFDHILERHYTNLGIFPPGLNFTFFALNFLFNFVLYGLSIGIAFRKVKSLNLFKRALVYLIVLDAIDNYKYFEFEYPSIADNSSELFLIGIQVVFSVIAFLIPFLLLDNKTTKNIYSVESIR